MLAYKILLVENGLIVLADIDSIDTSKLTKNDVRIEIIATGFVIKVDELSIAIPERIIDFFLENHMITLYPFSAENYIEEPAISIELSREAIIEARGVFTFWRKSIAASQGASIDSAHCTAGPLGKSPLSS